ncbi:MAG: hypothetical protein BM556_07135 [Bacteriovorax sp. MedPE-SWde]|nr:MAG: hypothetical protein BM556_07135 [Bacteriovorax sp. MedPE-SWde]
MLEGDLFTQDDLNPIYYSLSSGELEIRDQESLESKKVLLSNQVKSPDFEINIQEEIVAFKNGSSIHLTDFFTNIEAIRSTCEYSRLTRRLEESALIKLKASESIKNKTYSSTTYWKFYKVCTDLSVEYKTLADILFRLVRTADFKRLFDGDVYLSDDLKSKALGENFSLQIADNLFVVGDTLEDIYSEDICGAVLSICNFCENWNPDFNSITSIENEVSLNEILSLVEYPMFALNHDGIVILHNEMFSQLSILPSVIADHADVGWIEHQGEKYKILFENIEERYRLFTLVKQGSEIKQNLEGQTELGIISGSLAHELNNPVAGILAAISLLELEEWDDDNIVALREMKESGLRCKGLIDTFLGFSKFRGFGSVIKPLNIVLQQSTTLLRYRVIESGLNISVDVSESLKEESVKASVLPMVFYLLFNEMLTILSHKLLINSSLEKNINLSLKRVGDELLIVNNSFSYDTTELKNFDIKLISHLMEMENMGLDIENEVMRISGIYDE